MPTSSTVVTVSIPRSINGSLPAHGTGDLNTAYGTSFVADHHQENLKIDHVINARHKIAVNGSYQTINNDYIPVSGPLVQWPGGYLSKTLRKPQGVDGQFDIDADFELAQ